ncbi:MAG: flippase-like domain-containing protein [Chloroflexota bacterium]|nr:flippase-like domain-containing protein [Chloroflexota bacterium]
MTRQPFWQTDWFRVTVGTIISAAFLVLALKDVPLGDVAQTLARTNYAWLALAVLAAVVQSWLRALRWIRLYFPLQAGLRQWQMFGITVISQMLNIVVPWRIGELARIYLAGEIEKRSRTQTLATLGVEKIFDTEMLLLILLSIPLFMALPNWLEAPREGLIALTLALFAAAFGLLLFRAPFLRLLARVRLNVFGKSLDAHAQMALLGLDVFKRWDVHLELQALSVVIWSLGALINYIVLLSLDLSLPAVSAFLLLAVLQVGGLVPSSPGKVGVFQYLCILALALFAVDKSMALAYGILLYLVAYGPPVILGILFLWWNGVNLSRVAASGEAPQ